MQTRRAARRLLVVSLLAFGCVQAAEEAEDEMSQARRVMIEEIEEDVRSTVRYTGRSSLDARVMEAMGTVPRHEFVGSVLRREAYFNRPLPIGEGQTISQPYIVALMTDLAEIDGADRVLEIGTGSGYQAAVLAELADKVYSIEIVEPLGLQARARLARLGYENVEVRIGDGGLGWPEQAPFDAILVTAACPEVPQPLVDQLRPGGRLVLPLEAGPMGEELTVITKKEGGSIEKRGVLPVRFVPLTGEFGDR